MSRERSTTSTGAIAGTVNGPSQEPLAGAVVMISGDSPAHLDIAALTDAAGRYRFDNLQPGLYNLLVNAADYRSQSGQVMVEANQIARLDFALTS
ncbi:MAG: carboxypeptidase-like regulatory domain-containing protein [Candidatus Promineifilaceae bacterium]